jgi:hypothetical protein
MSGDLDARIVQALAVTPSAGVLSRLIDEANLAAAQAVRDHEELSDAAADPMASVAEELEKSALANQKAFERDRLFRQASALGARLTDLRAKEEAAERARIEAQREAQQQAARDQWDREYPVLANRIAALHAQLVTAGLPAPTLVLGERYEGPNPSFCTYLPAPVQPYLRPSDYAPSCAGDLVLKAGGAK